MFNFGLGAISLQSQNKTYGSISWFGFAGLLGEEDKLGLVFLKTLHIGLQTLHGGVPSSMVYSNADGWGILLVDACSL